GFRPGVRTVQHVLCALVRQRHGRNALRFLKVVEGTGLQLNAYNYTTVMRACCMAESLDFIMALYRRMTDTDGIEPDIRIYDTMLRSCRHHHDWRTALRIFDEMQQRGTVPDALAWTKLL
ncbi:hypothetical protein JKP88DRAFT_314609, partial [Tribonema minus]